MKEKFKKFASILLIAAMIGSFAGCAKSAEPGTYSGTAAGYHGDITVTTKIGENGKIADIAVGENEETEGIGSVAIEKLPQMIIDEQSLDIDVVAGATLTSSGILSAVANSLESAGADPAKYGFTELKSEEETTETLSTFDKDTMPEKKAITGSVTVTDAKGRNVTIDLPVSSYAISTMDVIDYIIPIKGEDAFNMLVGSGQDGGDGIQKYAQLYTSVVGDYTTHLGQISDHNAPFDLEMILAMDPDVLIVNSAMSAHKYVLEVEEQLTAAGIKIILIDVPGKKLDKSVQQTLTILGKIFEDTQYNLIASKNLSEKTDKPTVYYEKSGYSEVFGSTATSASGWGLPILIAGGTNIADAVLLNTASGSGSSNTLDPEYVIEADPDYIIVSGINDGWLDSIKKNKTVPSFDIVNRNGWGNLTAIKNGDLYEFAHSTSRSIYAFYPCLKMAKLFYPEDFSDVDPEAVLNEFFDKFMLVDSDISTWFISYKEIK